MKQAVLLVNLGSPDSPAVPDVRRYLGEFLMDERVIDIPRIPRWLLVHGAILPFRPKKSAEAYHKIWTSKGSPLVVFSRELQANMQKQFSIPVALAMRYQNPSIRSVIETLLQESLSGGDAEIILVPLYPHYAASTVETVVVEVKEVLANLAPNTRLKIVQPFYENPEYIEAMTDNMEPYLKEDYDHLLFSYHGLPERHLKKADPTGHHCLQSSDCCSVDSPALATCYRAQAFRTAKAIVAKARIPIQKHSVSFQSRLGRQPWLQPYTDHVLARLAASGMKKILVVCPSFVADCLETLEEIGIRGRETFLKAGGQNLALIPCLNSHPRWVQALANLVRPHVR